MRLPILVIGITAFALLVGCGGSSTPLTPTPTSSQIQTALEAYRVQCGGVALPSLNSIGALNTAAIKHAGWQARYDQIFSSARVYHFEGTSGQNSNNLNQFYVADAFADRIRAANGGSNLPSAAAYYEIIASQAGDAAVRQLWNTVYHRLPMMRHRSTGFGYGDMSTAAATYPTFLLPTTDPFGNVPPGNGYGTFDYVAYATPTITASWWPYSASTTPTVTNVPTSFSTNSESPDPIAAVDVVGPPLHAIFPTSSAFTGIDVTLLRGATHVPCYAIVGGGGSPTMSTDVLQGDLIVDTTHLNPGEVFIIPKSALNASTTYQWSISVTSGLTYVVDPQYFSTGP